MSALRQSWLNRVDQAQFQNHRVRAISQGAQLPTFFRNKAFWLIGIAALLLTLAACSSSDPTTDPTTDPTAVSTVLPSTSSSTAAVTPTDPAQSPGNESTATPEPTSTANDDGGRQVNTSTPLPDLPDDPTALMRATLSRAIPDIAEKMIASENLSYIPVLLEFMRFQTGGEPLILMSSYLNRLLEGPDVVLIDPQRVDWQWWIEFLGQNPQIQPPEGYDAWKGELYSIIDPGLGGFLFDGVKTNIRLEEIVWGGVSKDGIPDLQNPPAIAGSQADYLEPNDRVFGVTINGESKAYPLRILNLHEMANDVVGGVPFALAY